MKLSTNGSNDSVDTFYVLYNSDVIQDGLALTVQTALSEAPVSMDGVSTDHLNANVTVDTRE